ncbi:MAG: biotin--[acetyl-CoA-carboxylase] ligase [Paracoccaceae bacterium]|nr:biotin--[acetyl-CoA-carboxylase] ligase [Paracoccaceae bacterium]
MSARIAETAGAWPEGVARHILEEVDSTSSQAARLAPSLTQPTWIMARRQTAARGRRGRVWLSPEGNFAATLVMRPSGAPDQAALRSFVAALALRDALALICGPAARLSLKWPNDVLLNGGKVAGILLESVGQGPGISHLAIGIGVNLIAAPPPGAVESGAMAPVSILGETALRVSPEELLTYVAAAFARWEAQFVTYGFAPIRNAWLAGAARLGQPITARMTSETVSGTFETIAEDGSLVLATPQGTRNIPAADVFF